MQHRVPLPGGLGRIKRGVADCLEVLGNLAAAGQGQMPVAQFLSRGHRSRPTPRASVMATSV